MKKIGVQGRLLIGLAVLFGLAFYLIAIVLIDDAKRRLHEYQITQTLYQAHTLADASLDALLTEDYELLARLAASALPNQKYAYASLVRPDGQVLIHTNPELIARHSGTITDVQDGLTRQTQYQGRPVLEAIYPAGIGGRHLANAHVAFYLDVREQLYEDTAIKVSGILLTTVMLLILGTTVIIRRLIHPIKELTDIVAHTTIDTPAAISPRLLRINSEVGVLANTFHDMSAKLAFSYKELKDLNLHLEERVRQRTHDLEEINLDLRQSRSRLRTIMNNVAEGIITIDENETIETFNQAAGMIFQYSPLEAVGKNLKTFIPDFFLGEHDGAIELYVRDGQSELLVGGLKEGTGKRKDGSTFPLEIAVSDISLGENKLFIGIVRDITARKAMVDNLRHVAEHDDLTGLYSRGYFEGELTRVLARAHREQGGPCALFFIDLDNFKCVNDTFGHAAGDEVLRDVAEILRRRTRASDLIARLGGDEFAVIIYDTTPELALLVAESFRQQLEDYVYEQDGRSVDIGCSVGVVMITPDSESADQLVKQADHACYQAKAQGRNRVCMVAGGRDGLPDTALENKN